MSTHRLLSLLDLARRTSISMHVGMQDTRSMDG